MLKQASTRPCFFINTTIFKIKTFATTIEPNSHVIQNIHQLCSHGQIQQAISLFYTLNPPPPQQSLNQTYATLFKSCANHNLINHGISLHRHMTSHTQQDPPSLFTLNHLVNMYAKLGYLDTAQQLFDEMLERNIVSWTILVSGYAQYGLVYECFSMFKGMLLLYRPTEFAFASIISSGERDQGQQVHALALKICYDSYVYVANALITMYCKSSCCNGGNYKYGNDKDEAWRVFDEMKFRNLISWNSMIAVFQASRNWFLAIDFFSRMRHDGIGFDRSTLLSLLSSVSSMDDKVVDLGARCCFQLHSLCIKHGFMSYVQVATALVKCYSNIGGEYADCQRIFSETNGHRDLVLWTGMITAFAERDPEKALLFFHGLRQVQELMPDRYTFSTVIKACSNLATARHAMAVHSQIVKAGVDDDTVLGNALIHAYSRCGSIVLSKQIFDEMSFRDIVSWNSMLKAYALHGQAKESINLFQQMNLKPDSATFVALLSSCSHAGTITEGTKIFDTMLEKYGVVPQIDHFACMIDILGRVGRVHDAHDFITKMPMEPDSVIWSILLGACRKHGDTQLAKLASSKINALDPSNSLGYVQMSNLYCLGGSFYEASVVRKEMEVCKVRKTPGLSWIEIGNQVHEFASGGQCHEQRDAIVAKLEHIIRKLKAIGYIPETSLALHDIEEEQKEEQLYHHSEKLALVFAIMNLDALKCGNNTIKIMKNIRICVDCHNFMKLSSELFDREIVVRDSNRFHRFKDQVCSCNDFW